LLIAASTSENHCQKQADADKFVKRSVHYELRGMVCDPIHEGYGPNGKS
jgi:hypothetical protein